MEQLIAWKQRPGILNTQYLLYFDSMTSVKPLLRVLTVIAIAIFFSCSTPMKTFNDNANGWKPDNFNPAQGILLVEKITWPKNQQKKIEEFMAKSYPHKYEFVDFADLSGNNKKFEDKNIYRFALVSSYSIHTMHQNEPAQRPINVGAFDFNFIDRLENKEYPKSGIFSSLASMTFKKIITTCLEKKQ